MKIVCIKESDRSNQKVGDVFEINEIQREKFFNKNQVYIRVGSTDSYKDRFIELDNPVYNLECVSDIDKLRTSKENFSYYCGFKWSRTPQNKDYWQHIKENGLTPQAKHYIDCLIKQYDKENTVDHKFVNGSYWKSKRTGEVYKCQDSRFLQLSSGESQLPYKDTLIPATTKEINEASFKVGSFIRSSVSTEVYQICEVDGKRKCRSLTTGNIYNHANFKAYLANNGEIAEAIKGSKEYMTKPSPVISIEQKETTFKPGDYVVPEGNSSIYEVLQTEDAYKYLNVGTNTPCTLRGYKHIQLATEKQIENRLPKVKFPEPVLNEKETMKTLFTAITNKFGTCTQRIECNDYIVIWKDGSTSSHTTIPDCFVQTKAQKFTGWIGNKTKAVLKHATWTPFNYLFVQTPWQMAKYAAVRVRYVAFTGAVGAGIWAANDPSGFKNAMTDLYELFV